MRFPNCSDCRAGHGRSRSNRRLYGGRVRKSQDVSYVASDAGQQTPARSRTLSFPYAGGANSVSFAYASGTIVASGGVFRSCHMRSFPSDARKRLNRARTVLELDTSSDHEPLGPISMLGRLGLATGRRIRLRNDRAALGRRAWLTVRSRCEGGSTKHKRGDCRRPLPVHWAGPLRALGRQRHAGLCGGLFADRTEAIRFAIYECQRRPQSVIMLPDGLELDSALTFPTKDDRRTKHCRMTKSRRPATASHQQP